LRSRRNLNMAIRKIAIPMQSMQLVDPSPVTLTNQDGDMRAALKVDKRVGRSVFRAYTLGNGEGAVNTLVQVGKNGTPQQISYALARREIARSNMNVLEIECVVRGHVNENGLPYNVNQVYHVEYEKDGVNEDMYVYAARYDLTKDHGRTTTLRLCRLGTLVADVPVKRK
jgi:hypothetical protein